MEDESTVTTVSQGMRRPNGANTALNFLAGRIPAELSANKLIGASVGTRVAGTGKGDGFVMLGGDGNTDGAIVGSDFGDGG